MSRRTVLAAAVPAVAGLFLVSGAAGAWATGSDDTHVPYDVTVDGVTLPAGDTFADSDHVNVRYTYRGKDRSANLHIEREQPSRAVIGQSSVSWEIVGVPEGSCITWVQVSGYDEHFGEGHQKPVCQSKCRHSTKPTPSPTPSPSATPAQKTPEVEETPAPEQTPDVEETPAPEATPEVPAVVDADEPTDDTTPDVTETPTPAPQPVSAPQPEATPTVPSAVLADEGDDSGDDAEVSVPSAVLADESPDDALAVTGSDALLPGLLLAFAALGGGAALRAVHLRKRYTPNHRL